MLYEITIARIFAALTLYIALTSLFVGITFDFRKYNVNTIVAPGSPKCKITIKEGFVLSG